MRFFLKKINKFAKNYLFCNKNRQRYDIIYMEDYIEYFEDKDIIEKLSLLKQIKPREEWVFFLKERIISQRDNIPLPAEEFIPVKFNFLRSAAFIVSLVLILLAGSLFLGAETEDTFTISPQISSVDDNNQGGSVEGITQNKKEISEVKIKKELKGLTNVLPFVKSKNRLEKLETDVTNKKLSQVSKEKLQEILTTLTTTEEELLKNKEILATLIENEIDDLESRALTDDQEELLKSAKIDFEKGYLESAIEKIWKITNPGK